MERCRRYDSACGRSPDRVGKRIEFEWGVSGIKQCSSWPNSTIPVVSNMIGHGDCRCRVSCDLKRLDFGMIWVPSPLLPDAETDRKAQKGQQEDWNQSAQDYVSDSAGSQAIAITIANIVAFCADVVAVGFAGLHDFELIPQQQSKGVYRRLDCVSCSKQR